MFHAEEMMLEQILLVVRSSNFYDLLPQLQDEEWLNYSSECYVSGHNVPEK